MTRAQIQELSRTIIRRTFGSATEGDPIGDDLLLTVVTDDIASKINVFYVNAPGIDMTTNVMFYAPPSLYSIKAAHVLSSAGKLRKLTTVAPQRMDELMSATWRNADPADPADPTVAPSAYAVIQGGNQVRIYPEPSVTRSAALVFEGFGAPGNSWPNPTNPCPLPIWTHKTVAYGLALEICLMYIDVVSDKRVAALSARFNDLMETCGRQTGEFIKNAGRGKATSTNDTRADTAAGGA